MAETSRLSILLVCKQINQEATGIAYSKTSFSLDRPLAHKLSPNRPGRARTAQKLNVKLQRVLEVFGTHKLSFVPHLRVSDELMLADLARLQAYLDVNRNDNSSCTIECRTRRTLGSPIHTFFL